MRLFRHLLPIVLALTVLAPSTSFARQLVAPQRGPVVGRLPTGDQLKPPTYRSPCPEADGNVDFEVLGGGISVGELANAIVSADLDASGGLDLVATSRLEQKLVVRVNSAGSSVKHTHDVGGAPTQVAVGNFLAPDSPSILVLTDDHDDARIFYPIGGWDEVAHLDFPVGQNPGRVRAADLNNDGRDDFVTVDLMDDTLTVNLSTPVDDFVATTYPSGACLDVGLGDINKDGHIDIVYPSGNSSPTLNIRLNDGNGSFLPPFFMDAGASPTDSITDLLLTDMNKDGYVDFLATANGFKIIRILATGPLTFAAPVVAPIPSQPVALVEADFDVDGNPDYALLHPYDLSVYLGDGNGNVSAPFSFELPKNALGFAVAGPGSDKLPDLVVLQDDRFAKVRSISPCDEDDGPVVFEQDIPVVKNPTEQDSDEPVLRSSLRFRRGDTNGDGSADMADGIRILDVYFRGSETLSCQAAADTNGDDEVTLTDTLVLFNHLFLGGPSPAAPFAECGRDDGPLGCESYDACKR